jgi:phage terminase large subunit GpA-like protein
VEAYEAGVVPDGVLLLTCGVDVQDNRLAVSVWGWGREEEGWLVHHSEVWGDPTRTEVWKQLDQIVLGEWKRSDGQVLKALATCVDSGGHNTGEVYMYARDRRQVNVVAIKGASMRNKPPIGKEVKVDLNLKGRILKRGASVFSVGTDTIKDTLFGRLRFNDPGPGFLHFGKAATPEFFEQLTAERKVTRYSRNGMPSSEYVKATNARNEALDTAVYAYAGLHLIYRRFDRRTIWDQLEKKAGEAGAKTRQAPAGPRQSFVSGW